MTHLVMMDFPRLSLPNILTHRCCLLCCYWDFSKPHTYQCYQWGNVLRGQPDSAALSCGIYDLVSTNDLLSHLFFPGAVDTPQRRLMEDIWEHLILDCFSVVPPTFPGISFYS